MTGTVAAGLVVRARTPADVPVLVDVLTEQQPHTRYPLRWPLPFAVERFIVRDTEERAWVAELDGRVVGHVMVGRVEDPEAAAVLTRATGSEHLACVSVLFVARDTTGSGVGGVLLDTAVAWARERGRQPVLDVVSEHATAMAVYRHRGWREVGRLRPAWLPEGIEPVHLMALSPPAPTR